MTSQSKWACYPDVEVASQLDNAVKFHLTYEGRLLSAGNRGHAAHKHDIRRSFHRQLRQLWMVDPRLDYKPIVEGYSVAPSTPPPPHKLQEAERRASNYSMFGHRFVPLLTEADDGACVVEVLLLRADMPKQLVVAGDIDGRVKTIIDALRMPQNNDELAGATPGIDEDPFFVLLRDDKLIEGLSVEMGRLLSPTGSQWHKKDSRVVITVKIVPTLGSWSGMKWI